MIRRETLRPAELEASLGPHRRLTAEFHTRSADPSQRRMLVDVDAVQKELDQIARDWGEPAALSARVHVPRVDRGIADRLDSLQNLVLCDPLRPRPDGLTLFYPNTTTLVGLRVDRETQYVRLGTEPLRH